MAVATPVFHSPVPAAAAGSIVLKTPKAELPRCINDRCDSHLTGVFRCEDPEGDGAVCTTCGMQQALQFQLRAE